MEGDVSSSVSSRSAICEAESAAFAGLTRHEEIDDSAAVVSRNRRLSKHESAVTDTVLAERNPRLAMALSKNWPLLWIPIPPIFCPLVVCR